MLKADGPTPRFERKNDPIASATVELIFILFFCFPPFSVFCIHQASVFGRMKVRLLR
uniref:Uncharacterized protein n=1 Tax=Nelumbo nucifera TaxID=4432 RepID=A0A822ZU88_NELNU|nr:TPA_asm: hypothetical protein HUJ06_016842 [Nelumbo nucifera]